MATTHFINQHLLSRCTKKNNVQTTLLRTLSIFPAVPNKSCIRNVPGVNPTEKVKNSHHSHRLCSHHPFTIQQRTYVSDIIMGMSQTGFTCFDSFHSLTGLPWWFTIVLVVAPMRIGLQLLKEYHVRNNSHKLDEVHQEMLKHLPMIQHASNKIGEELPHVTDDLKVLEDLRKTRKGDFNVKTSTAQKLLFAKHNCHPLKPVALGMIHIPVWLSLSMSLREMAGLRYFFISPRDHVYQASLHTEGFLWFPDLIVPDPYLILPVTASLSMLASIELANLTNPISYPDGKVPGFVKALNVFSKCTCVMLLVVGINFPSAVTFYWCVSSLSANFVNLVLLSPRVLKTLNFKTLPKDRKTPYRDLYDLMNMRYNPVNWYSSMMTKLSKSKNNESKAKQGR